MLQKTSLLFRCTVDLMREPLNAIAYHDTSVFGLPTLDQIPEDREVSTLDNTPAAPRCIAHACALNRKRCKAMRMRTGRPVKSSFEMS